jgi:hypothetical protein
MREPELEEESLTARIEGGQLIVTRRSVEPGPTPEITVTAPDGTVTRAAPHPGPGGRSVLEVPATTPGVWQASDGRRTAFAAAAATNPLEVADLRAEETRLRPIAQATGGAMRWMGAGTEPSLPEIRRVAAGRDTAGGGWIGLRRNTDTLVTGIAAMPLLPPWLALLLVGGTALIAWRREGR